MRGLRLGVALILWAGLPALASAGDWVVCDYTIRVDRVNAAEHALAATIRSAAARNPAECMPVGESLAFQPATPDYQSLLPRKKWPRAGELAKLRYRHLDGECKNDGRGGPCRIRHYSILPAR